jgi:hypothetical protein
MNTDTTRRFLEKVSVGDGCWEWQGALRDGYGIFRHPSLPSQQAHRIAYELLEGPIPPGLELDHLCRNRRCIRPDHLEPVTHKVNLLRGEGFAAKRAAQTHCTHGHELAGDNVYLYRGLRQCRSCHKRLSTAWARVKRARQAQMNSSSHGHRP